MRSTAEAAVAARPAIGHPARARSSRSSRSLSEQRAGARGVGPDSPSTGR
jgi:hypothetical protein